MNTYYMIVFKPLTSIVWTPVTEDTHRLLTHDFAKVNWSSDLLHVRKICQHYNSLGLQVWLAGIKAWDRLVFRIATVKVAGSEDVAMPKR